ncbi:ATP synthase F0 subunit A [Candidatus Peribacteria bacterium RIFCSPHIGHO2_01_FULL_55_13]|nr:MAG: ATP synthase F0 subunit A [Candidatus Peribacteria bacterium RIFCSPHIGHO2_01_FULL_55_13]OGJ64756.1 MAG: ATP synthase F0 subunit A [Candidatus Peribacteria bacterium RIFCSPHIGHO2_12_FULL_55_11]
MSKVAISLASETVAHVGGFEIRNTMLMAWLAMVALFILCACVRSTRYKLIPGRFQATVEWVISGLYDLFASIVHDDRLSRKFFPLVSTIFIFIVLGNWMGILPGVGSITIQAMHEGHMTAIPLFRSMNADVNMTLAIAISAIVAVQFFGARELGASSYSSKFIAAPWRHPMQSFVGLLEMIGEFSRIISFTFRLFGNIFAGEVLLLVISYLVPYVAPIPFLAMELFVGLIQGLVFALLTTVFLKIAVTEHEAHHDDDAPVLPAAAAA